MPPGLSCDIYTRALYSIKNRFSIIGFIGFKRISIVAHLEITTKIKNLEIMMILSFGDWTYLHNVLFVVCTSRHVGLSWFWFVIRVGFISCQIVLPLWAISLNVAFLIKLKCRSEYHYVGPTVGYHFLGTAFGTLGLGQRIRTSHLKGDEILYLQALTPLILNQVKLHSGKFYFDRSWSHCEIKHQLIYSILW